MAATNQPVSIFASEAFAALTELPAPKAWERREDGSILIMGAYVATMTLSEADAKAGYRTAAPLPLRMSASMAHVMCRRFSDLQRSTGAYMGFEAKHADYIDLAAKALAEEQVDARLSPRSREFLEQTIAAKDSWSTPDRVAYKLHECERRSFSAMAEIRMLGYGRGDVGIAKLLNSFLWTDVYVPEIARATILLHGQEATFADYHSTLAEWPDRDGGFGLGSLMATHRAALPFGKSLLESHARLRNPSPANTAVACVAAEPWTPVTPTTPATGAAEAIQGAPRTFRLAGLKPAVWRMMLRMSVPQLFSLRAMVSAALGLAQNMDFLDFEPLQLGGPMAMRAGIELPQQPRRRRPSEKDMAVAMLNRLAELGGEKVPRTFLHHLSMLAGQSKEALLPVLKAIVDEGVTAVRRKRVKISANHIGLIADAWRTLAQEGAQVTRTPNVVWDTLVRASDEWHARGQGDGLGFATEESLAMTWEPLLARYETPTAVGVELVDGTQLQEEGKAMGHCVAGYAYACTTGRSRIFALRLKDDAGKPTPHRSTLEATLRGDSWRIAQNRSVRNKSPHPKLTAWGKTLIAALNKAQKKAGAAKTQESMGTSRAEWMMVDHAIAVANGDPMPMGGMDLADDDFFGGPVAADRMAA
jgi:hypothetical protein